MARTPDNQLAWYRKSQPVAGDNLCSHGLSGQGRGSDCDVLARAFAPRIEQQGSGKLLCIPVGAIRRETAIWRQLSPKFRRAIKQQDWIAIHPRAGAGSPETSLPMIEGAPDCTFISA